jgi:site-specific DNA-adenine methylase
MTRVTKSISSGDGNHEHQEAGDMESASELALMAASVVNVRKAEEPPAPAPSEPAPAPQEPELPEDDADFVGLADVLEGIETVSLMSPVVYLVEDVPEDGDTDTVNLLIKGPMDKSTREVIQLSVGKAIADADPSFPKRIRWVDDESGCSATSLVPLFDMALTSRESLAKIQMMEPIEKKGTFNCFGNMDFIAKRLMGMFPEHKTYVEVFCGHGETIWHKEPSEKEVMNDLDKDIVFLHRQSRILTEDDMKDFDWVGTEKTFKSLATMTEEDAAKKGNAFRVYREWYLRRFSKSGRQRPAFRNDGKGGLIDFARRLKLAKRLKEVTVENMDFRDVIKKYDAPDTLFLLDPPYPSRTKGMDGYYKLDCPDCQDIADALKDIKGKFVVVIEGEGKQLHPLRKVSTEERFRWPHPFARAFANLPKYTMASIFYNFKKVSTRKAYSGPKGERGSHDAVLQLHFRGASVHGDFRVKFGDVFEGWTLNMQKPGRVQPVDTVAQARKVASGLSLLGNASIKPLRDGRVMAEPKDSGPAEWVDYDGKVFEPGEAGASTENEGVLIAVARPTVELGRQEEAFREYFLSLDRWLLGVLMLRRIAGDGKSGEPYWIATMGKTWLPSVLKTATVKAGVMPPDGASWMPETLERETPKEWRFWELSGADAKAARDALVKSGWFTEQNVRMVDGEFHRLVTKFYPTPVDPDKPEVVTEKIELDPWRDFVNSLPAQKAEFKPLVKFTPMKASPETTFTKMDEVEASFANEARLKAGIAVEPAFKGATVVLEKDASGEVLAFFADKAFDGAAFIGALTAAAESLPDGSIVVGELVIGDKPAVKCSDALYMDGESLVTQGYDARSARLGKMLGTRGKGALHPTPQRVAHNVPALRAAVEWASAVPGADGVVLKCMDAPYTVAGKSSEVARINLVRQLRTVVLAVEKSSESLNVLTCGIGPLVNGSDAKAYQSAMEHNGNTFIIVGKSEPTKIDAQVGQVVRVIPSGMRFVDSENGKAVTCAQMTVEERVKMRPNTVEETKAMMLASERTEKRMTVSILKSDEELRFVLGVVLEPNDGEDGAPDSPDAHKDIYSFVDVRDAAWLYLSEHHQIGLMHQKELATADYQVCESYLAPVDFELGGQKILKGSWMLGARILNDAVWQKVKAGKLNAWSIDGRAIRTPEPAADDKTAETDTGDAVA